MLAPIKRHNLADFDTFVVLPENSDKVFEYIGGEIIEVPSNLYVSEISTLLNFFIQLYLREHKIRGHVTGEAGGYDVMGERYAPDVAYISQEKQQALPYRTGYNSNPSDLAVEVVSPNDRSRLLNIKIGNYLAAGTVVWVVYPSTQDVEIYTPGQAVIILDRTDTLDGNDVLPGFSIPVKDIFPEMGD